MSECLHRVTDDYNAMNDLLKYGLIRTGISEVVTDLSIEVTDIHLVEEVLRGIERYITPLDHMIHVIVYLPG